MADEPQKPHKPGERARPDDDRAAAKARTEALDALEERLEKLRFQFDQHFLGNEKRPPTKEREAFNRDLRRYDPGAKNAVDRFRHQNLIARFVTYDTYWGRILRAIEEGTYERDRFKADLHQKQRAGSAVQAAPTTEAAARADTRAKAVGDEAEAFLASLSATSTVGLRGRPVAPIHDAPALPVGRTSEPGALSTMGMRGTAGAPQAPLMRGTPISSPPPAGPIPAPASASGSSAAQPMRGTSVEAAPSTAPAQAPDPAPAGGTPALAMRGAPVGGTTTPPMRAAPVGGTPTPAPMRGAPVGGTPTSAPMRGAPVAPAKPSAGEPDRGP